MTGLPNQRPLLHMQDNRLALKPDNVPRSVFISATVLHFLKIAVWAMAACNISSVRRVAMDYIAGILRCKITSSCRKEEIHSQAESPLSTVLWWPIGAECWPA